MSIGQNSQKSNRLGGALVVLLITLAALAGFALGGLDKATQTEDNEIRMYINEELEKGNESLGFLVASKKGSRYHFPWCTGAKAMNEENKVWFKSYEAARAAGYTPAGNCPGLE